MHSYLITDPKYYSHDLATFEQTLEGALKKHKVDFACYRDKEAGEELFDSLAESFVRICRKHHIKNIFIHSNIDAAFRLKACGVHLGSRDTEKIFISKSKNLKVVSSTHSKDEIAMVSKLGADYVTFGPIYETPEKGAPKGVDTLKDVIKATHMPIFALGGIEKEHLKELKDSGVYGYAAIRFFVED